MKFVVLPIAREILHTTNDIAIPVRELVEKYKSGSPICHGINFDFSRLFLYGIPSLW